MEDMEEEMELLRDQLDYANKELETIRFDKDRQISDLESKILSTKSQVEAEFRGRMKAADREFKAQLAALNAELDNLRSAFSAFSSVSKYATARSGGITSFPTLFTN